MKYTEKSDDKADKKAKIKEGSKKDKALDKKRGVPETSAKKILAGSKKAGGKMSVNARGKGKKAV